MEYLNRLQRAVDYIDAHLEADLRLEDAARVACYSRSHFLWIFKAATGLTPMDYVRRRKLTEAAAAILSGADIADTVYRFGFSAQDVFTRSFRRQFGVPPARFRRSGGAFARFTPTLRLHSDGGAMRISYNLDCQDWKSTMRVEKLLADDVLRIVAELTVCPRKTSEIAPELFSELCDAQVLRTDGDVARPNTAVFLEQDLRLLRQASLTLGPLLARSVARGAEQCAGIDPSLKRYLVGYQGVDVGTFGALLDGGYAWNHRAATGKYATAKIDVYEVCDTYDSFGPYLSGGYGFAGQRFAVHILGEDGGVHSYLRAGLSLTDDRQYRFLMDTNAFLIDALGSLLLGETSHHCLERAAEEAGFLAHGGRAVPVIREQDGPRFRDIVRSTRQAVSEFIATNHADMESLLASTLPGRQGVPVDRMVVDLMRYVRMVAHQTLYDEHFYADSLPEGGTITVFRERSVDFRT